MPVTNNPITGKDPSGLLTQAQNTQLNSIKAQLLGIAGQLSSLASSGNASQSALNSIQQSIYSAGAAIARIAVGGGATVGPSFQWAPQTSNKIVTGNTAFDSASGVSGIPGSNSEAAGNLNLMLLSLSPAGPEGPDEILGARIAGSLIERNGFKFTPEYYQKLWDTGRMAPSLIAQEIKAVGTVAPDLTNSRFVVYTYKGWRLVVDPVTNFVQHLGR